MAKEQEVIFRRINGRVVPIRRTKKSGQIRTKTARSASRQQKEDRKRVTKGFALAAGGLALSAASSFIAGKFTRFASKRLINAAKAARASSKSKDVFAKGIFDTQNIADFGKAMKSNERAKLALELGVGVGGASLVSAGLEEIAKAEGMKDSATLNIATDISAAGLTAAAMFGYKAGSGVRLKKMPKQMKFKGL